MGLEDFINRDHAEDVRMENFEKAAEGVDKKELRALEEKHLKPQPIPKYFGRKASDGPIEQRSVKFIFETIEDMERCGKFFKIGSFNGLNSRDTGIIMKFVELFEDEVLRYNRKAGEIEIIEGDEWEIL